MGGKIIYLTGDWAQPSETFVRAEARRLQACGVPLAVASVFSSIGLADDVHPLTRTSSPKASGSTRHRAPSRLRSALASFRHNQSIKRLIAYARSIGASHLHAAFGGLPALLCAEAAKRLGVPYSVSVHANDVLCPSYHDARLYRNANRVFCCNGYAMDRLLLRSSWLTPKVVLARHGIDLDAWPFNAESAPTPPLKFLFVGRLVEKKDPQRAEALVAAVKDAGIGAELTVIGDGPVRLASTKPLGFLPHDRVRELMRRSDFLICTSRETASGDAEGVPNVLLEAMATGLPIVSTVSGSIGEVVRDDTSTIIDSDNRFPGLIRAVLDDPEGLERRVRGARELVESEWNARTLIDAKVDYFRLFC